MTASHARGRIIQDANATVCGPILHIKCTPEGVVSKHYIFSEAIGFTLSFIRPQVRVTSPNNGIGSSIISCHKFRQTRRPVHHISRHQVVSTDKFSGKLLLILQSIRAECGCSNHHGCQEHESIESFDYTSLPYSKVSCLQQVDFLGIGSQFPNTLEHLKVYLRLQRTLWTKFCTSTFISAFGYIVFSAYPAFTLSHFCARARVILLNLMTSASGMPLRL